MPKITLTPQSVRTDLEFAIEALDAGMRIHPSHVWTYLAANRGKPDAVWFGRCSGSGC
jgi:hypothetical protein